MNRFQVKFNDATASCNSQDPKYTNYLIVDRRSSVLDLKLMIADHLEMPLAEIVFKRGGTHGSELSEDDLSLK